MRAMHGMRQTRRRGDAGGASSARAPLRAYRASQRYLAGEDVAERDTLSAAPPLPAIPSAAPSAAQPGYHEPARAVGAISPLVEQARALRRLRSADWTLILAAFALCALGLLMVFSVSQAIVPDDPWSLPRHQALAAALGALGLIVASRVDYHRWRRLALPGLALALALMTLTLLIGLEVNGGRRWLGGDISFQPSEPAKLALIVFLADWFARVGPDVRTARRGLLPFVAATGALVALTLAQRDMGTATVIVALAFAMYFTAGARLSHLLALLGAGGLGLAALAIVVSYRRARLAAFLNPVPPGCHDPNSYQVCQGLLSLGSGGVFGAGLGASVQKAGYLPLPQSDSIYAVLGGELGLLGCALTLGLLVALIWRGYRAGRRAPDSFGALLACGITTWFAAQAAINIGGVVAAIPFTGVPLPFISYGGAALVSALVAVGALLNVAAQGAPLRIRRRPSEASPWRQPEQPDQSEQSDDATATESERQRLLSGMPLATAGYARTSSEPGLLARTRGEEHEPQ
ncbi:MAG TPA: putative peptidoglycan glycosyltransferase FtsW [Ktedonobacterales bacterium]|nr:putative peptidoglycan glycosyltransferase FtsW [Ktedonobacterales bacterium]